MNAPMHPIFQRLFEDMASRGLLPEPEQRAGESFPELSSPATERPRYDAEPARVWPSHGGCEL